MEFQFYEHVQRQGRVAILPSTPVTLKALKPKEVERKPQTLGEHIRKRRLQLGLSQKDAAKRLGYCWTTVLNWEKGKRRPSVECLPAIITFLGYDPFPEPTTLSKQLAALRRKMGWSIKQAARHLGVDPGTWGRWEKMGIPWTRHQRMVAAFVRAKPNRRAGVDEDTDVSDGSAEGESEGINVR